MSRRNEKAECDVMRCYNFRHYSIKYFGPLDDRKHHHISDPMLEEDMLCRLSGTVLTSTPSLLGLPLLRYTISATLAATLKEESASSKLRDKI